MMHEVPKRFIFAVFLCAIAACGDIRRTETTVGATAFVNVDVISMEREIVLGDQTVVVIGDRIQAMGPSAQVAPPANATIIDGNGKYLAPGLADMHAHLWPEGDLLLYVANGVTTIRSLFGGPTHLQWREEIERGDRLGPTIYTTGPILDGSPPRWQESTVVTSPEEARAAVIEQKAAGYDGVKVYVNLESEVYDEILSAAQDEGISVYGHVPARVSLWRALEGSQRSYEHMADFVYALSPDDSPIRSDILDVYAGKRQDKLRVLYIAPHESADETRIPDLVSKVVERGVWICPTLAVSEGTAFDAEEVAALWADPAIAYVAPEVRAYWKMYYSRFESENIDPAGLKRGVGLEFRSVRELHRAGARLLVGTDTPNPGVVPGLSIHDELQNFVDVGFTPYEALKAATVDAAAFMEAGGEFGKVAVGMRADLLLLERNPLEDISATRNRVGVMARGRWYSDTDLSSRLEDLAARYAKATSEDAQPK